MKLFSKLKKLVYRNKTGSTVEAIEIIMPGINTKFYKNSSLTVPNELSVFIPRLELSKKLTQNGKTIETSLILNSLTIVSAPRHKPIESGSRQLYQENEEKKR